MMSKWISAESVISKLNSHVGFTTRPDVMRAIKLIQDEPSIDIVRCKECRYYLQGECIALHTMSKADDYCSYGERREP